MTLQKNRHRLIDSFTEGLIEKDQFTSRMARTKTRIADLDSKPAVRSAQRNVTVATDRYKLGIDPYLNVITAQTTLLSNQQTAVNLRMQQMTASVQLIEALGRNWSSTQLPSQPELISITPPSDKR